MMFFTILGIVVAVVIAVMLILSVVECGSINHGDGFIFTVFTFGFVYAKPGTMLNRNCNNVRKTENKSWFFNAPEWFNKYVANLGGVK
ncbi:MAG: hypothetical protein LC650_05590 [Actinobacteria bacterium]|nr:hypothetical protein [Actinomycetota bacterium]